MAASQPTGELAEAPVRKKSTTVSLEERTRTPQNSRFVSFRGFSELRFFSFYGHQSISLASNLAKTGARHLVARFHPHTSTEEEEIEGRNLTFCGSSANLAVSLFP